jgi:hypothetical protein
VREVSSGSWKPSEGAGSPGSNPYKGQTGKQQTEKQNNDNNNDNNGDPPNSTSDGMAVAGRGVEITSAARVGRGEREDRGDCG